MKREIALLLTVAVLGTGCGGSGGSGSNSTPPPPPPPPATVNWDLAIQRANVVEPLSPALVGFYDLSGALFDYDSIPGLVTRMRAAGFAGPGGAGADWRIGLGRWEISTEILATLSDGSACPNYSAENQSAYATDIELLASRDWFTFTDGMPVAETDIVDSRFALGNVRAVIDSATAFGATPYVSIDLMPRALSVNQTPDRFDCSASFTNSVSNNEPADPAIFAKATRGLVARVVEGTGSKLGDERPRAAQYWEVWNEPELPTFWEPTLAADPNSFFDMAVGTLLELDAYRNTTADANGQNIKIGLGSFLAPDTATTTIQNLDPANIPVDFISFHTYDDDPLVIVEGISQVAAATAASVNYQDTEIVLAEWGSNLDTRTGDQQYASTMSPALHVATVIALGAAQGLDRAHNTFFYDFYPVIAIGLIDNAGNPRRLYRAYELMAKLTTPAAQRLAITGLADGRLDTGMGAALVAADAQSGTVRVLLVNRNDQPRTTRISLDGVEAAPAQLFIFDGSSNPLDELMPVTVSGATFELPPESIAVAEF